MRRERPLDRRGSAAKKKKKKARAAAGARVASRRTRGRCRPRGRLRGLASAGSRARRRARHLPQPRGAPCPKASASARARRSAAPRRCALVLGAPVCSSFGIAALVIEPDCVRGRTVAVAVTGLAHVARGPECSRRPVDDLDRAGESSGRSSVTQIEKALSSWGAAPPLRLHRPRRTVDHHAYDGSPPPPGPRPSSRPGVSRGSPRVRQMTTLDGERMGMARTAWA